MPEPLTYDPSAGLGPIDRILLRGAAAHKSGNELSALTGGTVSPERAMERVLEILDARDWLSQAYMKMLLIDDMMAVKDVLMERAIEFKSLDHAKALVPMLSLIEKTLSAEKIDLQKAMTEISRAHSQIILQALGGALDVAYRQITEKYAPDMERSELLELVQISLPVAVREIEAHVPVEQ